MFKKLGLIIIDEQHKFGVKQRIELSNKGGKDCDILLMSATPIPRTLILSIYGDMDVSRLVEKPINKKDVTTLSKPEEKIDEIISFIRLQIKKGNQVFWVCPLIEESKILDFSAAVKKYNYLSKKFGNRVGLIHGGLKKNEKEEVLNNFLNKKIDILLSTTVIEVGIDFPNANVIVIENSNKFGLSQLHQLRGRVGRGSDQSYCILMSGNKISNEAQERLRTMVKYSDGFKISEVDLKLRGSGDMMGTRQSGMLEFKIADIIKDFNILDYARKIAIQLLKEDADLKREENQNILKAYSPYAKKRDNWSRIS